MQIKDKRSRASWWLTFMGMVAGVAGAAVLCYFSWTSVLLLSNSDLCQVSTILFYPPFACIAMQSPFVCIAVQAGGRLKKGGMLTRGVDI